MSGLEPREEFGEILANAKHAMAPFVVLPITLILPAAAPRGLVGGPCSYAM